MKYLYILQGQYSMGISTKQIRSQPQNLLTYINHMAWYIMRIRTIKRVANFYEKILICTIIDYRKTIPN